MSRENSTHNVYIGLGSSNHTKHVRSKNDFYATPPLAVRQLLKVEKFNNNIWEPACGMCHISDVLEENGYNVRCSDIVDMKHRGVEILNFLEADCCNTWNGDIITNPPFKYANEFVQQALNFVDNGSKVAMFLKIQFLEGAKRYKIFKENPPKIIYVASQRYGCSETGEFNSDGNIGSAICYCWYIWEKGFKGNPIIKWINTKDDKENI